ncbi:hypothetical protein SISSUDRAFT_72098 [Sistotremastrum suecicum HHB10207 ss-3]|uniref:Uncharacterized protein n=1 Tax=Sistotremastrum suecicum HHB10207 ss-3 TaxID=1314776 RepID=A0A166BFZ5_9AGAM|nr:hypothetical protein SISSUDRAFT_72098 [Sistotremastrum suecicum HHB10207 ss-3]
MFTTSGSSTSRSSFPVADPSYDDDTSCRSDVNASGALSVVTPHVDLGISHPLSWSPDFPDAHHAPGGQILFEPHGPSDLGRAPQPMRPHEDERMRMPEMWPSVRSDTHHIDGRAHLYRAVAIPQEPQYHSPSQSPTHHDDQNYDDEERSEDRDGSSLEKPQYDKMARLKLGQAFDGLRAVMLACGYKSTDKRANFLTYVSAKFRETHNAAEALRNQLRALGQVPNA